MEKVEDVPSLPQWFSGEIDVSDPEDLDPAKRGLSNDQLVRMLQQRRETLHAASALRCASIKTTLAVVQSIAEPKCWRPSKVFVLVTPSSSSR